MSVNGDDYSQQTNELELEASTLLEPDTNESLHHPRLCHLKKWAHFQGYGFNLHAERAKTGQHIGKVDADSPAESAGLKEGDRIIEVNNVNISNENHQQVVKRIRNGLEQNGTFYADEVLLLVLDNEADAHYQKHNLIVKANFKNVLKITTKPVEDKDDENNNQHDAIDQNVAESGVKIMLNDSTNIKDNQAVKSTTSISGSRSHLASNSFSSVSQKSSNSTSHLMSVDPVSTTLNSSNNGNMKNKSSSSIANKASLKECVSSGSNLSISSNNQSNSSKGLTPNMETKNDSNSYMDKNNTSLSQIDSNTEMYYEKTSADRRSISNKQNKKVDPFQMSAAEFKNYLKSKGRSDPRIAQVDMRQKFQMFQDM